MKLRIGRKALSLIMIAALTVGTAALAVGCSKNTDANSTPDEKKIESDINSSVSTDSDTSSAPDVTSNEDGEKLSASDCKITEAQAVDIALSETKKQADELKLAVTDASASNYDCEVRKKDGITFYDIKFKDLRFTDDRDYKTQVAVRVNADTGKVIGVSQYK